MTPHTQLQQKKATLTIQAASRKEMSKVAGMIRSSADWYAEFVDEKDLNEHYVDQDWEERNHQLRDFYLGYDEEGQAVGTLSLQYFNGYAYIGYLYLDTRFIGKGYGKAFMNFAREKVLKNNLKGMYLIAHPEAVWAVKAYEKYGFECIETRKESILRWNQACLDGYYEDGFDLYLYTPNQN